MQRHWDLKTNKLKKPCSRCKIEKSLTEFADNIGGFLGKHSRCRLCRRKVDGIRLRNLSPKQREKRKQYQREWKRKFRKENYEYCKNYYLKNKKKIRGMAARRCKKKKRYWIKYLPKNPVCQICGISLEYFRQGGGAVCFDHQESNDASSKILSPSNWLGKKYPTEQNIKLWKKCNFGILCINCNKNLPFKNRKNWTTKVYKYVFGKNPK